MAKAVGSDDGGVGAPAQDGGPNHGIGTEAAGFGAVEANGQKRSVKTVIRAFSCVALIVVGVVVISFAGGRRSEPHYNGKSLSQWLVLCMTYGLRDERGQEAYAAVKKIGTNALPTLVADLHWKRPAWLAGAISHWPRGLTQTQVFFITRDRSFRAQLGMSILGPEAAPAVPGLVRDLVDPEVSQPQIFALGAIGRPAWPELMVVLTTRTNSVGVRIAAIYALGKMGTNANDSVDVFIDCLRETSGIESWAAWAVARVAVDSESVVPALTNALQSPTVTLRRAVVNSLFELGSRGQSAVPALKTALTDVDEEVRASATNALAQIKLSYK